MLGPRTRTLRTMMAAAGIYWVFTVYYVPGPVAGSWHVLPVQSSRHPCGTGAIMTPISQLGKLSHSDLATLPRSCS